VSFIGSDGNGCVSEKLATAFNLANSAEELKRQAGGNAGEMGDLQFCSLGFYSPLIFAKLPVICEVDFQSSPASR
jgi:hypothetical protein